MSGNETEVSPEQAENANASMRVKPHGSLTEARSLHPKNALCPILVNVLGSVREESIKQEWKASRPISLTPGANTTLTTSDVLACTRLTIFSLIVIVLPIACFFLQWGI